MSKTLTEMAQEIVQAQAGTKQMTMEEIASSLQETFKTLKTLQKNEAGDGETAGSGQAAPLLEPKKSIRRSCIICLECGAEFKMLSPKHLSSHGLDAKSYRKKYGFSARQPLCARSLSERRSESGKARGVPENLQKYLDGRKAKKQAREATAAPAQEAVQPQAEAAAKKPRGGKRKPRSGETPE